MAGILRFRPLTDFYLFPYFPSRDQYIAEMGQAPPRFDPTRPPKGWADPTAAGSTKRQISYQVIAVDDSGLAARGDDGRPYFEIYGLPPAQASTYNLVSAAESTETPVPIPIRPLLANERLVFRRNSMPGPDLIMVENVNAAPSADDLIAEGKDLISQGTAKLVEAAKLK